MRAYFGQSATGPFVSLSEGGTVLVEIVGAPIDDPLALLDRALQETGRKTQEIKEIACDRGPGGFSSVRRRVAVAAALATALKVPVASLGSLDATAVAKLPASEFKLDWKLQPLYDRAPNITKPKAPVHPKRAVEPVSVEHPRAYTYADLTPKERRLYRLFEFIPATLVWITILGAVALSIWATPVAVVLVIAFDLYWFFRVLYFVFFMTYSWRVHRKALSVDWRAELQKVPGHERVVHVILLPTVHEPVEVLRHTLEALDRAQYPGCRMIVVLEGEERAGPGFLERAAVIEKEFSGRFLKLFHTVHPDGLVGEMKAKGANMAWAGPRVLEAIDELGIPHEDVLVSAFDCDTAVHPQYYAHLTKTFLETPDRLRASYQPAVLYSNNIWSTSPVIRISAFGTTFWLLSELARPERLFTFASHSMPLQMLIDVGWWQKDMVNEDSRIFLQGFIRYGGDYRVVPMYVPVSMDAVEAGSWWESLTGLYKQQRRWAWGVEHFPYMAVNYLKHREIPWQKRLGTLWQQVEGMYTWATAPILIFILGWLPMYVARVTGQNPALVQNAPRTLETILTLAMIGVFSSAILSLPLLPARPPKHSPWTWVVMVLQWCLLPFTFVIFGAIPAIDAQTRLALGKKFHLGFWVTPKVRT